jgi:hypothetical protein
VSDIKRNSDGSIKNIKAFATREEALAATMKLIDETESETRVLTPLDILVFPLDAFNRFLEKVWNRWLRVKK